jgi:peptidoglycan/xylan/chitin deacetylase (PgdA/CDA1 family)
MAPLDMTAFVTTSWDDGGDQDARLAQVLRSHGVAGTLYWTVDSDRFPLPSAPLRDEIIGTGIEIGSHTMTHPDLRKLANAELAWELSESKRRLEVMLGESVPSFCYPFGYFNRPACEAVEAAGYVLGRTTMSFRMDMGADRYRLPTTLQVYPHPRRVHVTHSLKERNVRGLVNWARHHHGESDLLRLTELAMDLVAASGGVLHLWGHSWELEEFGLWKTLDRMLEIVASREGVSYVTNGQLIQRS